MAHDLLPIDEVLPPLAEALTPEEAAFLDLKAQQIRAVAASAVSEIGHHLIEAKKCVGPGKFLAWFREAFPQWSRQSAFDYMNIAERMPDVNRGLHLEITHQAMRLLAGPSVPQAARDEAVELAEHGERVTKAEAEQLIAEKTREGISRAVEEFREQQERTTRRLIEETTARLRGNNEALQREIERIRSAREEPDTEEICRTIERSLGVKKLSSAQYKLLAELLGETIVVGRMSYDPAPRETIVQNEEHLRISSKITEALEILAGAPPPEQVMTATWEVQRKQHARVCGGVIKWLTQYNEMLKVGAVDA